MIQLLEQQEVKFGSFDILSDNEVRQGLYNALFSTLSLFSYIL